MLEVPQALLDERRAKGLDLFDEMWEGELHMVPAPSLDHQRLSGDLFVVLAPLAKTAGLLPFFETGLYRADHDWRVPDQLYARPDQVSARGAEGGIPLVVEIRSPGDETDAKRPWYAALGVRQVLVLDPRPRSADADRIEVLGVDLETVDGPRLRLSWSGGTAEI